jgi:hypothetical protein
VYAGRCGFLNLDFSGWKSCFKIQNGIYCGFMGRVVWLAAGSSTAVAPFFEARPWALGVSTRRYKVIKDKGAPTGDLSETGWQGRLRRWHTPPLSALESRSESPSSELPELRGPRARRGGGADGT